MPVAEANKNAIQISLPSLAATETLAETVGSRLTAGDCLLLEGDLGAGKTAFARALIQSLLTVPEDVPSPTFTLVQTYQTPHFDIWHCDLYRLSSADQLAELGLEEAFSTAVTLIEWPDRLGSLAPAHAQLFRLSIEGHSARLLTIVGDERWDDLA
ncbi:MAG: tRNA (adenosine(37)-N6)-threonylcarbamoyltransferase complex ATPase subunit type 1 TsaE [Pseudomonadota bacterium]